MKFASKNPYELLAELETRQAPPLRIPVEICDEVIASMHPLHIWMETRLISQSFARRATYYYLCRIIPSIRLIHFFTVRSRPNSNRYYVHHSPFTYEFSHFDPEDESRAVFREYLRISGNRRGEGIFAHQIASAGRNRTKAWYQSRPIPQNDYLLYVYGGPMAEVDTAMWTFDDGAREVKVEWRRMLTEYWRANGAEAVRLLNQDPHEGVVW